MQDGNIGMLDIYVQRELGEIMKRRLQDSEEAVLSSPLALLLDELRDASKDADAKR